MFRFPSIYRKRLTLELEIGTVLRVLSVYFTGWRRPRPFTTLDSEFFWAGELEHSGRFPFNPKFWKFRFGPTGIFGTSFKGGQLWPVWLFLSVGPKCSFPFDNIVVPSTALLYPAYNNNNQTRGGLGLVYAPGMYRSIGHVKLTKFQTGIFVGWKAPPVPNEEFPISETRGIGTSFRRNDLWDILDGQGLLMIG